MPQRSMPTSISMSAVRRKPASSAAASRAATPASESTQMAAVQMRLSAAKRASLRVPATSLLTRMSPTPPQARISASDTFCTHWPTAPRAIWRWAMTGDLWVFACGRSLTPASRASAAMWSRLSSRASRSMRRAGVSTSSTGAPGSAGGGWSMTAQAAMGRVVTERSRKLSRM